MRRRREAGRTVKRMGMISVEWEWTVLWVVVVEVERIMVVVVVCHRI